VATFLTGRDKTRDIFTAYRQRRVDQGHGLPDNDRTAYAALVYTGETDAAGRAGAEKLMWYITHNKVPPHYSNPPGYNPVDAVVNVLKSGKSPYLFGNFSLETLIEQGIVFAGSPDTVERQIRQFYEDVGGFGHLLLMGQAGFLEHDETVTGIRLFGREVYPRLRELG
jgi:alkanesulfonate monooxygenase SsuD/methylene tetrahydromethanopterin reductase-like flavin-dependent oxidoreductase (luciferase family)